MGLDISVYKPEPLNNRNPQNIENFMLIHECEELDRFKHLAFERVNEYFDLQTAAQAKGYKLEDLKWLSTHYSPRVQYEFKDSNDKTVNLYDPPVIQKKELCLTYSEVGYQRKGANKQFYDDDMWNSPCVVSLKTLNEHFEKYFSDESGNDFKENIIDKFVEGETFVIYH